MRRDFKLYVNLLFSCACCFGAQTVAFSELDNPSLEGKEVNMVGFLIADEHGEWFLAKQPNIKSCCMGKHTKIRLLGEFSSDLMNQVIRVQGVYQKGYSLESAMLIPK